jgi:hypothetical protein
MIHRHLAAWPLLLRTLIVLRGRRLFLRHRHLHAGHLRLLREGGRGAGGKRKRARSDKRTEFHWIDLRRAGRRLETAPALTLLHQLLVMVLVVLRAMVVMHRGHVFAAVFAAIHHLMLVGVAMLLVAHGHGVTLLRHRCRYGSGLGGSDCRRGNQDHHLQIS